MAKIRLEIELEYDAENMHGDDPESRAWFFHQVLGEAGELLLHSNYIGDTIGQVTVRAIDASRPYPATKRSKAKAAKRPAAKSA
jgi:hypothetical protein